MRPRQLKPALFLSLSAITFAACGGAPDAAVSPADDCPSEVAAGGPSNVPSAPGAEATREQADDSVPGIAGCSGTYWCKNHFTDPAEYALRAQNGECWIRDIRLMPDTTTNKPSVRWASNEGGFRVYTLGILGPDRDGLDCTTTSGDSKAGPKITAPHCQGTTTLECDESAGQAQCEQHGCRYVSFSYNSGACYAPQCYDLLGEGACSKVPGCQWD